MTPRRLLVTAALVAFGIGLAGPAQAACTISTSPLSFGSYNVFSPTPLDSTGSVTYRCGNSDHDITISLDRGGAPTFNPRRMLKGTEPLTFNLYLDAARTTIWGDGTGGTQTFFEHNPQGNNKDITITIYGRVPAGQDVSAGTYTNTVTATINF